MAKVTLGWRVIHYPLNGSEPTTNPLMPDARSKEYCQWVRQDWLRSVLDDGTAQIVIEPASGWEYVRGDPLAAVIYAVAEGELDPALAVRQVHRMVRDGGVLDGYLALDLEKQEVRE